MKKIFIWGTGSIATNFIKGVNREKAVIMGYVESRKKQSYFNLLPVIEPIELNTQEYDIVFVASSYTHEIMQICRELKINLDKFIFLRHNLQIENVNKNNNEAKELLFLDTYNYYFKDNETPKIIVSRMLYDDINNTLIDKYKNIGSYSYDYMRYRTFELVADMINEQNIKGDVAEVGVFRGEFARIINSKFNDRKLYLFDTFESFDETEFDVELEKGNCKDGFFDVFKNTSIDLVLSIMEYKENCIIKQGFFPESANDLDTKFAFVSIDVDFEESIYKSLEYFYPRLNEGGYIFIHDFNNRILFGVKKAVKRYEEKYQKLNKLPIADFSGTLVIVK